MRVFMPRLVLYAFQGQDDLDYSEWVSLTVLWALIQINTRWLVEHPETPSLYASGLRYDGQEYQLGQEDWMDIPTALMTCQNRYGQEAQGAGRKEHGSPSATKCGVGTDCKVLVAYRVAELRAHGEDARPWLVRQRKIPKPDGSQAYGYHVIVRRGDGTFEDPSKILGMTPSNVF